MLSVVEEERVLLIADFSAKFNIQILKGNLMHQFIRSKRNRDISGLDFWEVCKFNSVKQSKTELWGLEVMFPQIFA